VLFCRVSWRRPKHTNIPTVLPIPGNTKGGSITIPLTSCKTTLDLPVLHIKPKIVSYHAANSKPVKQEVNHTVILPPLVFLAYTFGNRIFCKIFNECLIKQGCWTKYGIFVRSLLFWWVPIHRRVVPVDELLPFRWKAIWWMSHFYVDSVNCRFDELAPHRYFGWYAITNIFYVSKRAL
jgi:hypothetical protein